MKYYSAAKRNEVLIHVTTWINFEKNILSEISQSQKPYVVWLHLCEVQNKQIYRNKSRLVIVGDAIRQEKKACKIGNEDIKLFKDDIMVYAENLKESVKKDSWVKKSNGFSW